MGRPGIVERVPRPLEDQELIGRIFRALGDPTRLRILELLLGGRKTQKELVVALGATQSRVSEHLACLTWCGFVEEERIGRSVCYRIADRRVRRLLAWARQFLEENAAGIAACRRVP